MSEGSSVLGPGSIDSGKEAVEEQVGQFWALPPGERQINSYKITIKMILNVTMNKTCPLSCAG